MASIKNETIDAVTGPSETIALRKLQANGLTGQGPNKTKRKGKKSKESKELLEKAVALDSSALYLAYKGPQDNKQGSFTASQHAAERNIKEVSVDAKLQLLGKVFHNDKASIKKYSRDFLLLFSVQCINLPAGFQIASDIGAALMCVSLRAPPSDREYGSLKTVVDRPGDRRGNEALDTDTRYKQPSPFPLSQDPRAVAYGSNVLGPQGGWWPTNVVLRNPHTEGPAQHAGGISRWEQGLSFNKGIMPSPHIPAPVIHKDEEKCEVGKAADEEQAKLRKLKGILKKLNPQNFERSFEQVKELNIDNAITLTKAISKIFDKASTKLTSCEMYANFCERLASELPDLSVDNEKITFRRLLLSKCKEDFERGEREEQEAYNVDAEGDAEHSEVEHAGNVGEAVEAHSREGDRNVSRVVSQSGSASKRSRSDADVTPCSFDGDEDRNSRLEGPKNNLKDEATKSESMSSQEEVSRLKAQSLALQAQIEQQQRRIDADIKLEELRFVNMKKKMETKMLITLIAKEPISAEDGELKKKLIKRYMTDL